MALLYLFEWVFLILLILGVIFSFILDNLFFQGMTIFIFGMMSATFQELKKTDLNFPYILIVVGFILGYLIATKSGFRFLIFVLFVLGIVAGIFVKKWIKKHVETTK